MHLTKEHSKSIKNSLRKTSAPIVEIDLTSNTFDTENTKFYLFEFLNQIAKPDCVQSNYWARLRTKYKTIKLKKLEILNLKQ